MNDAKIVNADMGEKRTASYLADRPYIFRRRVQPLVDFEKSAIVDFDAR